MSSLRPTATAFVPSFSTGGVAAQAPLTALTNANQADAHGQQEQQQAHQTQFCAEQLEAAEEACAEEDGYYDELGNWVQYDEQSAWAQDWQQYSSRSPWQEQHQQPGGTEQDEEAEDTAWYCTHDSTGQAVQLLHSWFPAQPLPLLRQLLEACDNRLQEALQLVSEIDEQQHEQQAGPYAHPGGSAKASMQTGTKQQILSLQDESLFPALSAAASQQQRPAAAAAAAWPAPAQAGNLWGNNAVAGGRGGGSNTSSWSALAKAAGAAAPSSKVFSSTPASEWAAASTSASKPRSSRANRSTTSGRSGGLHVAEHQAVPWVQTGEVVAQEYAAARAEASDYARVRNACFQQATQAYLTGNKALAKELSAKGKAAAQQMWAAHERASTQIYAQRNAQLTTPTVAAARHGGSSSRNSSAAVIDLHGLHVREVQLLLPQQLAALKQQKQQSVNIIVGTGHHTKGPPAARVGPAVEALLQGLGFSYNQPQPGLLRVQLT